MTEIDWLRDAVRADEYVRHVRVMKAVGRPGWMHPRAAPARVERHPSRASPPSLVVSTLAQLEDNLGALTDVGPEIHERLDALFPVGR